MVNTSSTAERIATRTNDAPVNPRRLVTAAMTAMNYASDGAPFNPLLIKFADTGDFHNCWSSQRGDTPIRFYRYNGDDVDNFRPLGDFAVVANKTIAETPVMLIAPVQGHEDAVAHPTGFEWILDLDDKGSGNQDDLTYFWPQAPDGYQALGLCVGVNGQAPVPGDYWCIRNDYLQSIPTEELWTDAGQGWTGHNGDLSTPSLANVLPGRDLMLAPTTILSDQYRENHRGNPGSYCLVLEKLLLPVPGAAGAPAPECAPDYGEGTETVQGLGKVAVLPCLVVDDPATRGDPSSSPFYYLAAQPYWVCTGSFPSQDRGLHTKKCTVGTSQDAAAAFRAATSLAVGADTGVQAAPLSPKISVSYTREMQVSPATTTGTGSRTSTRVELHLEPADRILIWQKQTDFLVYRTGGDVLSQVTYQVAELLATDSSGPA